MSLTENSLDNKKSSRILTIYYTQNRLKIWFSLVCSGDVQSLSAESLTGRLGFHQTKQQQLRPIR